MPQINYRVIERKNPLTEAPIFYAQIASDGFTTLPDIAKEISENSTVSPYEVRACISKMEEMIVKHILRGDSVRLDGVGIFTPTLRSTSTPTAESFATKFIKKVHVRFTAEASIKYEAKPSNPDMHFNRLKEED